MLEVPGCDAQSPSIYVIGISAGGKPIYGCRCIVCNRCGKHTGNSHQGHYWKYCTVTNTLREFHFCCPQDCELEAMAKESEKDFDKNKAKVDSKEAKKRTKETISKHGLKDEVKKFKKDG